MIRRTLFSYAFFAVAFSVAGQSHSKGIFAMYAPAERPVQFTHLAAMNGAGTSLLSTLYTPSQPFTSNRANGSIIAAPSTFADTLLTPFGGSVASIGFDISSNRLYYFPTYSSELRYMDLASSTPHFAYLSSQSLNLVRDRHDVAHQFSRMVIGTDGWGYALSNDAEHLIQFSTRGKPVILDLGSLTDLSSNSVFVKSSCTSWGGDMVLDKNGRLVLITQSNYVFQVDPQNRTAAYIGQIQGLPAGFTTNGAAVTESGELILSCSASRTLQLPHHFYQIADLSQLQAKPVVSNDLADLGNVSDLASQYLLGQPNTASKTTPVVVTSSPKETSSVFTLYPNPVRQGKFHLRVRSASLLGEYEIHVMDMSGRMVLEEKMSVTSSKESNKTFTLPAAVPGGVYVIKLVDYYKRTVYSTQFIVE